MGSSSSSLTPETSSPSSTTTTTSTPAPIPPAPLPEPEPPSPKRSLQQPGPRLILGGIVFTLASSIVTRRALLRRRLPMSPASMVKPGATRAPRMPPEMRSQATAANEVGGGGLAGLGHQHQQQSSAVASVQPGAVAAEQSTTTTTIPPPQPPSAASPTPTQQQQPSPEDELNSSGPLLAIEALTLATLNVISLGMLLSGGILTYFAIDSLEDLRRKVRGGLGVDGTGRSEQELEEEMEEWVVGVLARREEKDAVRSDLVREREREREGGE
ncbi:MAG: hypothetical protein M1828_005592 [Chrysothrix sp. TS-e1954]|nr:MAG: hypothetical protein M1828_005592 [Chrysothrix sp. TS-e1954]